MAHVFISYAHDNGDFVALLKLELEKAGLDVWIDSERLRAGEEWRQSIDDAIKTAFALVAVMSPQAFESKYVTYEWAFALGMGVKVIPLMIERTDLHPRLETLQYLDFTNRADRPWPRLTEHLRQIEADYHPGSVRVPANAPPAVKQAATALDSPNIEERKRAVASLAQIDHTSALEALANAVHHPMQDVRTAAAFKLAELSHYQDSRAVSGLIEALSDRDIKTSERATRALGRIGDESAIPRLLDSLNYDDGSVRRAAATALSRIGVSAVPGLLRQLDHAIPRVRELATWTLGELKDPAALPGLMKALRDIDLMVYKAAHEAIQKIGPVAVPELCDALNDPDRTVRQAAVKLLGEIGDSAAAPALLQALRDSYSDVRTAAADTLAIIGGAEAIPALIEALHDPDSIDVQSAAARALGVIGDPSAVPVLAAVLQADSGDEQVGQSFGQGLQGFTSWNAKYLAKTAAEALEAIGSTDAIAAVRQWQQRQKDNR